MKSFNRANEGIFGILQQEKIWENYYFIMYQNVKKVLKKNKIAVSMFLFLLHRGPCLICSIFPIFPTDDLTVPCLPLKFLFPISLASICSHLLLTWHLKGFALSEGQCYWWLSLCTFMDLLFHQYQNINFSLPVSDLYLFSRISFDDIQVFNENNFFSV